MPPTRYGSSHEHAPRVSDDQTGIDYRVPPARCTRWGYNGNHRTHTIRLLDLPGIWAEIIQYPTRSLLTVTDQTRQATFARWRGLRRRGLLIADITHHAEGPHLCPVWAAATWMLIDPERACAWNAAYDRAYMGALAELGVPPAAWASADSWQQWLEAADS